MKKFLIFLVSIVVVVTFGLTIFYFLKNDEVISVKNKEFYVNAGNSISLESLGIEIKKNSKKTTFNYNAAGEEVTSKIKFQDNAYVVDPSAEGQINVVISTSNKKYSSFEIVFHVGNGSEENPYYIFNESDLNNIGKIYDESKNFTLMNNIALSESFAGICSGEDKATGFSGKFLGNGYTIKNLKLSNPADVTTAKAGLFSSINQGALVTNLVIEDANISGRYTNVGVLAGTISGSVKKVVVKNSKITNLANSSNTGILAGTIAEADLVQMNAVENSSITIGSEDAAITEAKVGGFAGIVDKSTVQACYANGVTIATAEGSVAQSGGFVGQLVIAKNNGVVSGSIQQSYASAKGAAAAFANSINKTEGDYTATDMLKHLVGNFAIVEGAESEAAITDSQLVKTYDTEYFKNVANQGNRVFFDQASSQYMVTGYAKETDAVNKDEYIFYALSKNDYKIWDTEYVWKKSNTSLPTLVMGNTDPQVPGSDYYRKDLQSSPIDVGNIDSEIADKKYFFDEDATIENWEISSLANSDIDGKGKTLTINNLSSTANVQDRNVMALFSTITNSTIKNLNIVIKSVGADADTFAGLAHSINAGEGATTIENVHITFENNVTKKFGDFAGLVTFVGENTVINNCSVTGLSVTGEVTNIGGIATSNNGTISNCIVKKSSLTATNHIGGIVAINRKQLTNVTTDELVIDVKSSSPVYVGAITASNEQNIETANANAKIVVSAAGADGAAVGAIAGVNHSSIKNAKATGEGISVAENVKSRVYIGGIAAHNVTNATIENCSNNMAALGSCYAGSNIYTAGIAVVNQGNITKTIAQANISGNWAAGAVIEMKDSQSARVDQVYIGKLNKEETQTIKGNRFVAGIVVDFRQGTITNVQATSKIESTENATKSSLMTLIFAQNATLKNATINSSIVGNGAKYRETWTDFAHQIDDYKDLFGFQPQTGMSYFNIATSEAYHGVMQSVVVNLRGEGVSTAIKGEANKESGIGGVLTSFSNFLFGNGWTSYDYDKDSSTGSHVYYVSDETFATYTTYSGSYNYEFVSGETVAKKLEFDLSNDYAPWTANDGNGIKLSFIK